MTPTELNHGLMRRINDTKIDSVIDFECVRMSRYICAAIHAAVLIGGTFLIGPEFVPAYGFYYHQASSYCRR